MPTNSYTENAPPKQKRRQTVKQRKIAIKVIISRIQESTRQNWGGIEVNLTVGHYSSNRPYPSQNNVSHIYEGTEGTVCKAESEPSLNSEQKNYVNKTHYIMSYDNQPTCF